MSAESTLQSYATVSDEDLANTIRYFLSDPYNPTKVMKLKKMFSSIYTHLRKQSYYCRRQGIKNLSAFLERNNISILPHYIQYIHTQLIDKNYSLSDIFLECAQSQFPLSQDAEKIKDDLLENKDNLHIEEKIHQFFNNRNFYSQKNINCFANIVYPGIEGNTEKSKLSDSLLKLRNTNTLPLPNAMQDDKDKLLDEIKNLEDRKFTYGSPEEIKNAESAATQLAGKLRDLANKFYDAWKIYDENGQKEFLRCIKKATTPGADDPDHASVLATHRGFKGVAENIMLGCTPVVGWGLLISKGVSILDDTIKNKLIKTPISYLFQTKAHSILDKIGNVTESAVKNIQTPGIRL